MNVESISSHIALGRMDPNTLLLKLSGEWKIDDERPSIDDILQKMESATWVEGLAFNSKDVTTWDTSLLTFLNRIFEHCEKKNIPVDRKGLPQGVKKLIELATAVPEKEDTGRTGEREPFLERVGSEVLSFIQSAGELMGFIGEAIVATARLFAGKASFRPVDLGIFLQDCGAQALPIVTLISILIGLILSFIGIIQLKIFGAQIFVADLVGLGTVRMLGPIMTGVIMAGRTGGAFAAQLGTMQVNEEIDALRTLGISPMEFLVLPRMLALVLMMPLLALYSNLMGILGGMAISVSVFGLNSTMYLKRTQAAVGLNDLFIGLFMAAVFGVLVALSGCMRGMQCGRSASAVGDAATSAVVTSIVAIVLATAVITILTNVIGI